MGQTYVEEIFGKLKDPRREQGRLYQLSDIIVIAVCAMISGAETWVDIADFGVDKEEWLREFLELPNGTPSHDTIARVFQMLDPTALQICFQEWMVHLQSNRGEDVVAIDGKTMRGSHDGYHHQKAIHLLHAWSSELGMVLGMRKVAEKTNEIPEIPQLLAMLHLKDTIVTLDAMGCQKEIVHTIVKEKEADYVIALKGNQGSLYTHAQAMFTFWDQHHPRLIGDSTQVQLIEKPRGKVERRICSVLHDTDVLRDFRESQGWTGLQTLARIEFAQLQEDQWVTTQTRFFISSLGKDAQQILRAVRLHWEVENKLHRVLDVTFRQDDSRIRIGNSPENLACLQHISLNLLKNHPKKVSIRRKRLQSARNDALRWQILTSFNP